MSTEWLDGESLSRSERDRALEDLARVNVWTLAHGAVARALHAVRNGGTVGRRLLDVGAGGGDIGERLRRRLPPETRLAACDRQLAHLLHARERGRGRWHVVADARALPYRDGSFCVCLQHLLWHHFDEASNRECLEAMRRVARQGVVVVDLRPSAAARRFFPALARLLRLERFTRDDGATSLAAAWSLRRVRETLPPDADWRLQRRFPFRWSLVWRHVPGWAGDLPDRRHAS